MNLSTLTNTAAALSDPTRVRILAALLSGRDGELCVCEVTALLDLAPSTISKHLLVLRQAGLVEGRKDGRWMHYRAIRTPTPPAGDGLAWVREAIAMDPQLKADAEEVRRMVALPCPSECCDEPAADRPRARVLFLCTGNSCRSQMAEGWARALLGDRIEAYSAGTDPQGLNPLAVKVMAEAGVDISGHTSKHADDLAREGLEFDLVVTVCGAAHEACPRFEGNVRVIHAGFDDPPRLAAEARAATEADALPHYRRVRDEIRAFIEQAPSMLKELARPKVGAR